MFGKLPAWQKNQPQKLGPHHGPAYQSTRDPIYDGNLLDGFTIGKNGTPYTKHSALCLETEGFPDAPSQPSFPTAALRPGEIYQHTS